MDIDAIIVNKNCEKNQSTFSEKRVKWGWYQIGCRRLINADVNGSFLLVMIATILNTFYYRSQGVIINLSTGNANKIKLWHV